MSLSAIERLSAVEFAASLAASRIFNATVLATTQEDELVFQIFTDTSDRTITWKEISKQARRHIRHEIDKEIMRRESLEDAAMFSRYRGTVVKGTLSSLQPNGTWTVFTWFDTGVSGYAQRYSDYPLKFQPIPERNLYSQGQQLKFMVSSVMPVAQGSAASLALIKLSRTAKEFPIRLAEELDFDTVHKAHLQVVRRFPGYKTELFATRAIPKSTVASLAVQLGERIIFTKELP